MEGSEYQRRQAGLPNHLTVLIILLNPEFYSPLQFIKTFTCVLSCHERTSLSSVSYMANDGSEE